MPFDVRRALETVLFDRTIAYHASYARVGGSVTAGVFLSQMLYWHDRGGDEDGWIWKTQADWEEETALTRREQETARRKLMDQGILLEKKKGAPPKLYYRLDIDRLIELLAALSPNETAPQNGGKRHSRMSGSATPDRRKEPPQNGALRQTSLEEMSSLEDTPDAPTLLHQMQDAQDLERAKLWEAVKVNLLTVQRMSATNFSTWIEDSRLCHYDARQLVISTPAQFQAEWLRTRLAEHILKAFGDVQGTRPAQLQVLVAEKVG